VTITLSAPSGASIIKSTGTLTILNDDVATPASSGDVVSVGDASVLEGSSGTRSLVFPVTLSRASSSPVSVHYVVAGVTASGGSKPGGGADFKTVSGTVSFPATGGETAVSQSVKVSVFGDTVDESNETLSVTLSSPSVGFSLGRSVGTGMIVDDDPGSGVGVGVGDVSVVEGAAGTRTVTVPVTLTGPAGSASVHYVVTPAAGWGKTGASGRDFGGSLSGTVAFAGSATSKTLSFTVYGDTTIESDDPVTITLSAPSGASIIKSTGTLTILNDD